MYCSNCGNNNLDEAMFCENCGQRIIKITNNNHTFNNTSNRSQTSFHNKFRIKPIWYIAIALVAILVLGFFLFKKASSDNNKSDEKFDDVYSEKVESDIYSDKQQYSNNKTEINNTTTYLGKADFTDLFMEGLGGEYEVESKIEADITLELGEDGKYQVTLSADSMKQSCSDFLDKNLESIYMQMFNEMGLTTDEQVEQALAQSEYGTMDKMVEEGKAEAMKSLETFDFTYLETTGSYMVSDNMIEFVNNADMSAIINDDGSVKLIITTDEQVFVIDMIIK